MNTPDLLMSGARPADALGLPGKTAGGLPCGLKRLADADAAERAGGAAEFAGHLRRLDTPAGDRGASGVRSDGRDTATPERASEPSADGVTLAAPPPATPTSGTTMSAEERTNARDPAGRTPVTADAPTDTPAESSDEAVAAAATNPAPTESDASVRTEPPRADGLAASTTRTGEASTDAEAVQVHLRGDDAGPAEADRRTSSGKAGAHAVASSVDVAAAEAAGTSSASPDRRAGDDGRAHTAGGVSVTPPVPGAAESRAVSDAAPLDSRATLASGPGVANADERATPGVQTPTAPLAGDRSGVFETRTAADPNADRGAATRASARTSDVVANAASTSDSDAEERGAASDTLSLSGSAPGSVSSTNIGTDRVAPIRPGADVAPEASATSPALGVSAASAVGRPLPHLAAGSPVDVPGDAARESLASPADIGGAGALTHPGHPRASATMEMSAEASARTHTETSAKAAAIRGGGIGNPGAAGAPTGSLAGLSVEAPTVRSNGTTEALPALLDRSVDAPAVAPTVTAVEVVRKLRAQAVRDAAANPVRTPAASAIERLATAMASGERLSSAGGREGDATAPVSPNATPAGTSVTPGQTIGVPLATRVDTALGPAPIAPHSVPLGGGGDAGELAASVRWTLGEGRGQALVNVTPAGLGPVAIRVSLEGEQMNVSILATQPGAREALESLVPRLREQLAADGHERVQVDLSSGQDGQARAGTHGRDADERSGTGRATGSDGDAHDVESLARHGTAMHDGGAGTTLARSLIDDWA